MSRKSNERRRERKKREWYERKRLAETNRPAGGKLPPRIGISAELFEDIQQRSLANIFAEESKP